MLKRAIHLLADNAVATQALSALEMASNHNTHLLRVLTYHRVDYADAQEHLSPSLLSATPDTFAQQMAFIAEHYHPISIYDVIEAVKTGKDLHPKAVMVTFDDAYQDFSIHAWPVMKQHGIPALLFVPTAFVGHPERKLWWDRLYDAIYHTTHEIVSFDGQTFDLTSDAGRKAAFRHVRSYIKSLPHDDAMYKVDEIFSELDVPECEDNQILSWHRLEELASDGVTLAAHTVNHPMVNRITLDRAVQEAQQSWQEITEHVGEIPRVFAYPSGGANEAIASALSKAGFKIGFTTKRGLNDLREVNPLLLRRMNVGMSTSINLMRSQLLAPSIMLNRFLK